MLRKVFAFTLLLPALAAADPPIRDCRAFLLDMSTLGFRAGICWKNIGQGNGNVPPYQQMENCMRKSGFGSLPCTMNLSMKL